MFRDAALRAKDISVNTAFVLESWVHKLSLNVWIVVKTEMNIRKYRVDRYVTWYLVAYALLNVKRGTTDVGTSSSSVRYAWIEHKLEQDFVFS